VRLLLDEQLNPAVAAELRRRGYDVITVVEIATRGATDPEQLAAAATAHRALVTYNVSDFQELLTEWAQKGLTHWGLIFVSEKTISQRSVGPLVLALRHLLDDFTAEDGLLDQAVHLAKR